jgi:hypothetical protein
MTLAATTKASCQLPGISGVLPIEIVLLIGKQVDSDYQVLQLRQALRFLSRELNFSLAAPK